MKQAMKETSGKAEFSLLVEDFVEEMVRVREFGAQKYAKWDWMHGREWTDYSDALRRHLKAFLSGESCAPDSKCHHMAHIAVTAMFLFWFDRMGRGVDNRPGVMAERILELLKEQDEREVAGDSYYDHLTSAVR